MSIPPRSIDLRVVVGCYGPSRVIRVGDENPVALLDSASKWHAPSHFDTILKITPE
jgi:hypothetical protein